MSYMFRKVNMESFCVICIIFFSFISAFSISTNITVVQQSIASDVVLECVYNRSRNYGRLFWFRGNDDYIFITNKTDPTKIYVLDTHKERFSLTESEKNFHLQINNTNVSDIAVYTCEQENVGKLAQYFLFFHNNPSLRCEYIRKKRGHDKPTNVLVKHFKHFK